MPSRCLQSLILLPACCNHVIPSPFSPLTFFRLFAQPNLNDVAFAEQNSLKLDLTSYNGETKIEVH